jgi:hypothetical protein
MSEDISLNELLKVTRGDRNLIEKIFAIFPGYKGYKEKEILRETDKIVREKLFSELKEITKELRNLYGFVVSTQGDSSLAREFERLFYIGDSMAEKIRHAPYGYKPFFNIVKIDANDLYNLIQYDASLASDILSLKNLIKDIKNKTITDKINVEDARKIDQILQSFENKFSKRDLILMKVIKA